MENSQKNMVVKSGYTFDKLYVYIKVENLCIETCSNITLGVLDD